MAVHFSQLLHHPRGDHRHIRWSPVPARLHLDLPALANREHHLERVHRLFLSGHRPVHTVDQRRL